jgi:hypothetical protein
MFEILAVCILVMQRPGVSLAISNKALFIRKKYHRGTKMAMILAVKTDREEKITSLLMTPQARI